MQQCNNVPLNLIINIEETKKAGTFEKFIDECGLEQSDEGTFGVRKELIGFTPIEVGV
jgi:hypothetical protein